MKSKTKHQKKSIFKLYRLLFLLLFSFVFGFVLSYLIYLGYWYRLIDGLKTLAWYDFPLYLILTFFVTLIIHELGHLLSFVFQKVKIRALYIHMLTLYRSSSGWKCKLQLKHWFLIGGFVVPNLDEITDDDAYQKAVTSFSRSLITAPIVTIVFMVLMNLLFILSIAFHFQASYVGFIALFNVFTTLFSLLYIRSFKLSNKNFYGDFVAHQKMQEDPLFQLVQILQYVQFSLLTKESTFLYLFEKIKSYMLEHDLKTTLFHQMLLMNYIEMVSYHACEDVLSIREKIMRYPKNFLYRTDHGLTLLYDIALYYYAIGDVEKSYQLMETIKEKESSKIDKRLRLFLQKQFEHLIHLGNHETFLNDQENHVQSMADLFDVLNENQEQRKPLPFQVWETPLVFDDLEDEKNDSE